jgi:hypothetical protein
MRGINLKLFMNFVRNKMNSVDMANNLIFRAKNLQEYIVETEVPEGLRLNGVVPFDISIKDGVLTAKVLAMDFNEAVDLVNNFIGD